MEACIQNNFQPVCLDRVEANLNYLAIPDAMITYARDTVFSVWQALEEQLSQVDPVRDPEMYRALDVRAEAIFDTWLTFRNAERVL